MIPPVILALHGFDGIPLFAVADKVAGFKHEANPIDHLIKACVFLVDGQVWEVRETPDEIAQSIVVGAARATWQLQIYMQQQMQAQQITAGLQAGFSGVPS